MDVLERDYLPLEQLVGNRREQIVFDIGWCLASGTEVEEIADQALAQHWHPGTRMVMPMTKLPWTVMATIGF